MDSHQFDRLTHVVAGSSSRRGVLRSVAGAIVLVFGRQVPEAAAQAGVLGPGEPCYDDRQCADYQGSPLVCYDNGLAYDGPLNCCTFAGSCLFDDGCCADATCVNGSCYTPPPPSCGSWGCDCDFHDPFACDPG